MNKSLIHQLQALKLNHLADQLPSLLKEARKNKPSCQRFIEDLIDRQYTHHQEQSRQARLKRARIPQIYLMETFPFKQQPQLDRRMIIEQHDSLSFIEDKEDLIFIGPTGCGKTGLATALLVESINKGYRGRFIEFKELIHQFNCAIADHTQEKILRHFQSYDTLLIDETGYTPLDKETAGLFFELIKSRTNHLPTMITTQLGFDQWHYFLKNTHMRAALLDRITVRCTVFNMDNCVSLRPKNITYASKPSQK
jgi:DNA replication protein DnaC